MELRTASRRLRHLILVLALASHGYVRAADAPAPDKPSPPETTTGSTK